MCIRDSFNSQPSDKTFEVVDAATAGGTATFVVSGPNFNTGETDSTTLLVPLGDPKAAAERLSGAGLDIRLEDGIAIVDEPMIGTPFFPNIGNLFDFYADDPVKVSEVLTPADRTPKEIFYIPAFLLLAGVVWLQRRRIAKAVI